MAMSRKHYRLVAEIIRARWDAVDGTAHQEDTRAHLGQIISDLIPMFREDNSSFDAQKFRHAATGE